MTNKNSIDQTPNKNQLTNNKTQPDLLIMADKIFFNSVASSK
ncbi:hypothetical protein SAMN05421640_1391 [Ekhidna lutea]|uniref:Uncharacterized protein n=1 Tax=Ekhidna lutea TaxID=447679 RepID=A0A239HNC1_EKHLU|nr:hypothetical protein SAMN05421640_1391 [Ekhidna lutea]